MSVSRRRVLRRIGALAAGAAAMPSFVDAAAVETSGNAPAASGAATPLAPVRLDRNENPYGPSPKAILAMQNAAPMEAGRYPENAAGALREAIARLHRIPIDRVVPGCGSGEVLRMAADAFL